MKVKLPSFEANLKSKILYNSENNILNFEKEKMDIKL